MLMFAEKEKQSTPLIMDRSEALIGIDLVHHYVHKGVTYTANYLEKAVANNNFIKLHFKTGEASAHLIIELECEGKVYFRTYSNVTITNNGTPPSELLTAKLTLFNRFGCRSNGNKTNVFSNPTFTGGVLRGNRMLPFGTGGTASGGTSAGRIESVICPNSSFIIELQNVSGQTRDLGIVLDWYEVIE